ncbi:hypothetical protein RvY_17222 [Ramazzottius varieornatus]|uniref:HTH CENPB-type domain-containing protein n=1 Tax=Ramazzottius varieornatus TaxID=947166 RepID=A0A1D1W7F9_RAMVA|nr:hypothetical protein RvY_17222 [Ramazzottius varieornatus]
MEKFNVRYRSTIAKLGKQREKYLALPADVRSKSIVSRKRKFDVLEEAAMKYHEDCIQKRFPVSFTDLKEEARLVATNLNTENFKGSQGWVSGVLRRNQLQTVVLRGEEAGSDLKVAEDWIRNKLPETLQRYKNADIFNCDETGSYCRSMPRKTLLKVGQRMKGGKKVTERISVMLCCSASGEKLPPLVIGRSRKPRAFTKVKLDFKKAGFTWANNIKAWITKAVFTPWLKELNEKRLLLLLDNASGHKVDSLSHVKLVFLPPKQTSIIQPLDQGIIKTFQAHESAAKADHRRENRENFQNLEEYKRSLTVLHSIKWIVKAWSEVNSSTIRNCFRKAGAFHMVENM